MLKQKTFNKIIERRLMIILCLAALLLISSCSQNIFREKSVGIWKNDSTVTKRMAKRYPYIIIHMDGLAWQLDEYIIDKKNKNISGIMKSLPAERLTYKFINQEKIVQNITCNPNPYDELHLSVTKLSKDTLGRTTLEHKSISKMEAYKKTNYLKTTLYFSLIFIVIIGNWIMVFSPLWI